MIKQILGLVAIGMVSISSVVFGAVTVPDGGFEEGGKWDDFSGVIDTTVFHSGLKSGKTTANTVARGYITELELLATYELSAWVKADITERGISPALCNFTNAHDEFAPTIRDFAGRIYSVSMDWTQEKLTFLAYGSASHIHVGYMYGTTKNTVWIDDVSISLVRTRDQNKVYYQNILNDVNSTQAQKDDANVFFAYLYTYVEKDDVKAISYLEILNTVYSWNIIGDIKLNSLDLTGAKTAYSKAQAMAIAQRLQGYIETITGKLEGVNVAIKQKATTP